MVLIHTRFALQHSLQLCKCGLSRCSVTGKHLKRVYLGVFHGWGFTAGLTSLLLIVLGFNDTSTLEGHFVSSPREREKRDRRESRGDEREGQGRKRNRNESEETEEIKTFPLYPYPLHLYKDSRPCPTVSQHQLDAPVM